LGRYEAILGMGGQAQIVRLSATGGAFLLALAALLSLAEEAPAGPQQGVLAAVDLAAPASSEGGAPDPAAGLGGQDAAFVDPAAGDEDETLSPAETESEEGRDPADASSTAVAPVEEKAPSDTASSPLPKLEEGPAGTASPAPSETAPKPGENAVAPAGTPAPDIAAETPAVDPIVAAIRLKLQDRVLRKGVAADDFAALEAFYQARTGLPLWITGMGFSAKAQALIAEIQKAGDWGLPEDAFNLPPASDLPATAEAQAVDEIKLGLAVLKYARYARGGRVSPSRISTLFDQASNLLDPNEVLREMAAAESPGAYLTSLHPAHDQFERLRKALVKAAAAAKAAGRKPESRALVQRLILNMERWRWMPRELGAYYVWNNVPAFSTRVMKDGKSIYIEKAIVGQVKYATPIFSAQMRSIVFNPEWVVPDTIKIEDLQPRLRQIVRGAPDVSVLRDNKLTVSYQGRPINAETIDWGRANIYEYTFTQPPGPDNVLGVLKFNFPNRHAIYMHDTVQRELFNETVRTLSHGCIRLNQPERLAALLLAEDKDMPAEQVKSFFGRSNTAVPLGKPVPVHLTYFTMAFDGVGKLQTYADIYGIDAKMAQALFGKAEALSAEPEPQARPKKRSASNSGIGSYLPGLFGN
jgi:L,D-transpeptidase YcbB